jgi:hypothetical protein
VLVLVLVLGLACGFSCVEYLLYAEILYILLLGFLIFIVRLMMRVLLLVAYANDRALLVRRCLQKQLAEVLFLCIVFVVILSARLLWFHFVDDVGHTTCDHQYPPAGRFLCLHSFFPSLTSAYYIFVAQLQHLFGECFCNSTYLILAPILHGIVE